MAFPFKRFLAAGLSCLLTLSPATVYAAKLAAASRASQAAGGVHGPLPEARLALQGLAEASLLSPLDSPASPLPEISLTQLERVKLAVVLGEARTQPAGAALVLTGGEAAERDPRESMAALSAFREVYGDVPVEKLGAMARTSPEAFHALQARFFDALQSRQGAPTRPVAYESRGGPRGTAARLSDGIELTEKLAMYREHEEEWSRRVELDDGGLWGEREATALFGAYKELDWTAAAEFYERVFKPGKAERIPASVHSDYVLALNRLGRSDEALAEIQAVLRDHRALSVSPQAWRFFMDEYLISQGTAHKNRALRPGADRDEELKKALAAYLEAYQRHFNPYAGVNALRMLIYLGGAENLARAKALAPWVRQSALEANLESFWPNANLLEVLLLEDKPDSGEEMRKLLPRLIDLSAKLPLERESLLAHLRRWRDLKLERGESGRSLTLLREAIRVLERGRSAAAPEDPAGAFTRALEARVTSLSRVNRIVLQENNLRYEGVVPASIVNYVDIAVFEDILRNARMEGGLSVSQEEDESKVRLWAKSFLERVYRLKEGGSRVMEDLQHPRHKRNLEALAPGVIDLMGAGVSRYGATNLTVNMLFGVADCRFGNFTYQVLMETWNRLRREAIMAPGVRAALTGDAAASRRLEAQLARVSESEYVFMQAGLFLPFALDKDAAGKDIKYQLARDAQGRLVPSPGLVNAENHTFTLRLKRDQSRNIVGVWLDDMWYLDAYAMGSSENLVPALKDFAATGSFMVPITTLVKPKNAAGPEERRTVEITFKSSRYSSPKMLIEPIRYSPGDPYFFNHFVKLPGDTAGLLADPERHARWRRAWEENFERAILEPGRGAALTGANGWGQKWSKRYPIMDLFLNEGAFFAEPGEKPDAVKRRARARLKALAAQRKAFFDPYRRIWELKVR